MSNNNHKPPQPSLPTGEVWRALLLIYNHYQLNQELGHLSQVQAAIRLLDCWLDIALQEGWMEGE